MMFPRFLLLQKNPSFRWFALGYLLSSLGAGMSFVALSWLILKTNNSVSAVSFLILSFWGPNIILGPFLGTLGDRYSRKHLVLYSTLLRSLVLIGFGLYFGNAISNHLIYILMFINGCAFSIFWPAGMALVREIVTIEDLFYANSIIDIAIELGNVAGMGAAGFIVGWVNASGAILINGGVFFLSTLLIVLIKTPNRSRASNALGFSVFSDFKLGLQYLQNNKNLMVFYFIQLLLLVEFMTTPILLAPFAKNILQASVKQFGEIDAALSVGVVLGGILMPLLARKIGFFKNILFLNGSLVICFILFAFNRYIPQAEIIYFCIGFGLAVWPLIVTLAQDQTDLDFQARIQSIFNSLSGLLILFIYSLVDFTSHYLSISILYSFEVVLAIMVVCLLYRYRLLFV